jgi:hypothetical protein
LESVGVIGGNSRDSKGRYRFLPHTPQDHLIPGHWKKDFWFWNYMKYPYTEVSEPRKKKKEKKIINGNGFCFHILIMYLFFSISGHGMLLRLDNKFSLRPFQPHVRD